MITRAQITPDYLVGLFKKHHLAALPKVRLQRDRATGQPLSGCILGVLDLELEPDGVRAEQVLTGGFLVGLTLGFDHWRGSAGCGLADCCAGDGAAGVRIGAEVRRRLVPPPVARTLTPDATSDAAVAAFDAARDTWVSAFDAALDAWAAAPPPVQEGVLVGASA